MPVDSHRHDIESEVVHVQVHDIHRRPAVRATRLPVYVGREYRSAIVAYRLSAALHVDSFVWIVRRTAEADQTIVGRSFHVLRSAGVTK